ncbi:MAG: hypothetical protein WAM92_19900 [Mycobacterium sp.]
MTATRRKRLAPLVVTATVAVVAALCGVTAPNAQAFYIQNHEMITRNALPPDQVDEAAVLQILIGPPPGAGAVGSDAFVSDEFRHIDNAKDAADICARTTQAWNFFYPLIQGGAQATGPGGGDLVDGPEARAAFGGLAHALQDFYSHSNWVELNTAAGDFERMPPPLMPTCDPAALPPELHTGYFSMEYSPEFQLEGCPPAGPPPGYAECHDALNKDGWNTQRGMVRVPGTGWNNFDLAALLATKATTDLFWQVRGLIAGNAGECVAANLFQADRHQPCWG